VKAPLILAVEPDRQQAQQLSSMFSRQFQVELVLANSTSGALAKLGDRIPQLVLTSALIRPRDEVALLEWLRNLGSAASHVQTVTIPVLATPEPPSSRRSGTISFGKDRNTAWTPDTCDPAVFADWISVYLDLASGHDGATGAKPRSG
jgi:CheY-like chemotaxis protein